MQDVDLLHSFFDPINPHLSGVLVGYKDVAVSVSATASAVLPQVLLSRSFHVAT